MFFWDGEALQGTSFQRDSENTGGLELESARCRTAAKPSAGEAMAVRTCQTDRRQPVSRARQEAAEERNGTPCV